VEQTLALREDVDDELHLLLLINVSNSELIILNDLVRDSPVQE
jgi:hypothetical protein